MTRGKYAARAQGRLDQVESERIRELYAEKVDLERRLADEVERRKAAERDTRAKAMRIAGGLSQEEKRDLRNRIASLEYESANDRVRRLLLTYLHALNFARREDRFDDDNGAVGALLEDLAAISGCQRADFVKVMRVLSEFFTDDQGEPFYVNRDYKREVAKWGAMDRLPARRRAIQKKWTAILMKAVDDHDPEFIAEFEKQERARVQGA